MRIGKGSIVSILTVVALGSALACSSSSDSGSSGNTGDASTDGKGSSGSSGAVNGDTGTVGAQDKDTCKGAAPGKDTAWKDPAQLKPETTTKEEVAARKRKRLLGIIPRKSAPAKPAADTGLEKASADHPTPAAAEVSKP